MQHPIWEIWQSTLPAAPFCGDFLRDGVFRRPRAVALGYRHLEINSAGRTNALVLDIDRDDVDVHDLIEDVDVPAPNSLAVNRLNGHAHASWWLSAPVAMTTASRQAPIDLLAAVQSGLTRRLGADPRYINRIAKNPQHRDWVTSWHSPLPHQLRTLFDRFDLSEIVRQSRASDIMSAGRNCAIFEALRPYAYRHVLRVKKSGANLEAWRSELESEARLLNLQFAVPLSHREIRGIAKSVAKWTWRRFDEGSFSRIQSARRIIGATKVAAATASALAAAMADPESLS